MARSFNTDREGRTFSDAIVQAVWAKARIVAGYNPAYVRLDICGSYIECRFYGDTGQQTGWEIDHIFPVARTGTDILTNLQALQWRRNRLKGEAVGVNYCLLK